jgi:hypothetical protein
MFSKGFILSVGLSLCSTILIYLYVKSRINNLENKVNSLIQIIQTHDQMSQGSHHAQMGAGQCNYEKIVVSDDEDEESSDEESSDEEEDEEVDGADNVVVQDTVTHDDLIEEREGGEEEIMDDKVSSSVMDLTSSHMLHDMEEHVVSPDADGLDDMDDLDEDLEDDDEEEEEDEEEENVDYSSMGKVELRLLCESKGLNVKGKKKHELIEILGQ